MPRGEKLLWLGLLLIGVGGMLILLGLPGVEWSRGWRERLAGAAARPTPEPIVPTPIPAEKTAALTPTLFVHPEITPHVPEGTRVLWLGRPRWGVGVASGPIEQYDVEPLGLGWYLDWTARHDLVVPEGIEYVQMIRLKEGVLHPDPETIATIARAHPGSLWLVGNEPDVEWQDDVDPDTYATLYHRAYAAIETSDPTALVAIGGVSQPTPLRMRYLDLILTSYRTQFGAEMPVDMWNVHNFVLREERGSWGVGIPPGMPDDAGMLYEIEDSGDLEIFRRQIVDFRTWMAERGYRDVPLIVSEYGILMPEDYGFPPQRVVGFLVGTFDFFLTATDPALGYPADDYRLVQKWCWYSLADTVYPTGNLFDPATGEMTVVGRGWEVYVAALLEHEVVSE